MVNRIKQLIEKKKLTAAQFAGEVGVQRSAVSHLLSGRNKPSLDFILKIRKRFPDIRLEWLLLGEGKMIEVDNAEGLETVKEKKDLFSQATTSRLEDKPDSKAIAKEPEVFQDMLKTEDAPPYGSRSIAMDKPKRVILLYPDNTFKIFDAR